MSRPSDPAGVDPAASLPLLTLPENSTATPGGGGFSVGGNRGSTSTQLESALRSNELLRFFGAQLTNQNWREEGTWTGRHVSGSAWVFGDGEASGLLRVQSLGDQEYRLEFDVIRQRKRLNRN